MERPFYRINLFSRYVFIIFIGTALFFAITLHLNQKRKHLYKHSLWQTMRSDFSLNHHTEQAEVQRSMRWFTQHQGFLNRASKRAAPFMYYIAQEIKKRHMPAELILLPLIESGYNPHAFSPVGAGGLWQLMPGTASGLGLTQNWWQDDKQNIIASTEAALNYLSYLHRYFHGNWLLAIAAYNAGPGTVANAVKKQKTQDFWSLSLPKETRRYVPALLALAALLDNPDEYPLNVLFIKNKPVVTRIDLSEQMDLRQVAWLADMRLDEIKTLNPGFKQWAMAPKGPYQLFLPLEKVALFEKNLQKMPAGELANWIRYKIKSGDTLEKIAKQFKLSKALILQINKLKKTKLHPGTWLILPINTPKITKKIATIMINKTSTQPGPQQIIHRVKKGETLTKIAKHYHVSKQALQYWNQLQYRQNVHAGDEIIVWMTPATST